MSNKRQENSDFILAAVRDWRKAYPFGPSFRDLAETTGIPLGTVHETCRDLRDEGKLKFEDHVARSIRLPSKGDR